MRNQLEKQIYKLQGVAGALHMLAASPEIAEISDEMSEMVNLLADEVRGVYAELKSIHDNWN